MLRRTFHSLAMASQTKHPLEAVVTDNTEPATKRPRCNEIVTDDDIFEHGRKVLECDVCAMFFFSQKNLDAHHKNHQLQRDYHCRTCDKRYTTADGLKLHRKSAHTEPRPRDTQQGGGVAPSDVLSQVRLKLFNALQVPTLSTKLFISLADAQFYLFL